jgi:hypothetical protein
MSGAGLAMVLTHWGYKEMKRLFASAALVAAVIASPALGEDKKDLKKYLGEALALMEVAPTLCGTSSSEIASFTNKVKSFALIKNWKMEDLEGIGDGFLAEHRANLPKVRDSACQAVNSFLDTKEETAGPPRAEIKAKCAGDWPDNYVMQEWCINNQVEAWTKVEQF